MEGTWSQAARGIGFTVANSNHTAPYFLFSSSDRTPSNNLSARIDYREDYHV
jgi:hypothetical protein